MNKITHFGITLQSVKYGFKFDENEYCQPSNKCSLPIFRDCFFHYNMDKELPKEISVPYLENLIAFYNGKKYDTKSLCMLVKQIKSRKDDYYLHYIKKQHKDVNETLKFNLGLMKSFDFKESPEGEIYNKEWCDKQLANVKENLRLNLKYFESLNKDDFENAINKTLSAMPEFMEVKDLKPFMEQHGYYIMVLDEYKQIYVGNSDKIGERIKQHWTKKKPFDRLIFPSNAVTTSCLSIDAFRALDTTRIYVYPTRRTYVKEDKIIKSFPPEYLLNRVNGGRLPTAILIKEDKSHLK